MAKHGIVTPDGKRYVRTKTAAGWWGLTPRTVARYCKDGRLPGAFRDSANRWCVPVDAQRPLAYKVIQQVLRLTLTLKNNPELEIDYSVLEPTVAALPQAYGYLSQLQYIRPLPKGVPEKQIPYRATLTQKGRELAFAQADTEAQRKTFEPAQLLQMTKALAELVLVFAKQAS